jgi:Polyketide cyclase / dehydrase and lipid transport
MPVDVLTETVINRPLPEVAAYAADPTNAPGWYVSIKSVEWKTPPPVAVGSRMDFVAQFLGRRLAYTYEITALESRALLVMRTAEGPFPMETTYTWTAVDDTHTRMTLRNRGEPAGISKIAAPAMAAAMRRANRKDLQNLKRIIEQQPVR